MSGHSHGASAVSVEVAKIKTGVKRKAEETFEVPSSVINVCIENSSQAALAALPTSDTMKKIVGYKENEINYILLLQILLVQES